MLSSHVLVGIIFNSIFNFEEINFIISGNKDMVDNFDFDEYIYSIYDAVKDLSKENRWGRDDEYTRIINNTIRTLTLRKKINNKEQKMEEGRTKRKG